MYLCHPDIRFYFSPKSLNAVNCFGKEFSFDTIKYVGMFFLMRRSQILYMHCLVFTWFYLKLNSDRFKIFYMQAATSKYLGSEAHSYGKLTNVLLNIRCRKKCISFWNNVEFNGSLHFQPLTEFPNKKCKRCGFYAKHTIKSDGVFGEWEFCPTDFTRPDGKYIYSVDKEVNATFICEECVSHPHIAGEYFSVHPF